MAGWGELARFAGFTPRARKARRVSPGWSAVIMPDMELELYRAWAARRGLRLYDAGVASDEIGALPSYGLARESS